MKRFVVLVGWFAASTAAADCGPERIAAEQIKVRKLTEEGRRDKAVGLLRTLQAECPDTRNLLYICRVYQDWDGHCVEAMAACDHFIKACANCDDLERGRRIRNALETACHAQVQVATEPPGARVTIDGKVLGTAPVRTRVIEGDHEVGATLSGYKPTSSRQSIPGGKPAQIRLVLQPDKPDPQPSAPVNGSGPDCMGLAWGGVAAGTVGLVLGTYFLIELLDVQKDIRDYGNCDGLCTGPTADDLEQDQTIAGTLTGVGFGLTIAGGATAAYCFHRSRQPPTREPKSTVTPAIGLDTVGVRIRF